jgi:hypothetical protein
LYTAARVASSNTDAWSLNCSVSELAVLPPGDAVGLGVGDVERLPLVAGLIVGLEQDELLTHSTNRTPPRGISGRVDTTDRLDDRLHRGVEYIRPTGVSGAVTSRTIRARDRPVFGVDVQSGDVRGDSPSYALVVLDPVDDDDPDAPDVDGPLARVTRDVVSLRKLRRLIDDREPLYVATDNAYELAPDKNALVGLLRSLPDGTRLVQVTGAERPEPLSRVASRHGIPYGKQPMQEAEAAARLAAANVGHAVTAFTDETRVKVARGRSTGKGGWSQDRYTRRIHGNVRKRTRQVQSKLDETNLSYERAVTEKYGGFANAVFTVQARPEDIPISTSRAGDVRVEIERERRDGIEYDPLVERRDRVIVGIDPGTTTAAAVVGLDGTVHARYSSRTADTAAVTEWIIEQGRPIIVAADVEPMPETVEKFRRSLTPPAGTRRRTSRSTRSSIAPARWATRTTTNGTRWRPHSTRTTPTSTSSSG